MQSLQLVSKNPVILRDYQERAIETAMRHYHNQVQGVVMVAPTGSGKTEVFSELSDQWVNDFSLNVLITAHRGELLGQSGQKISKRGMAWGKIKQGPSTNPQAPVQIASIQSLINRQLPQDPDIIIVDEAHLSKSQTYMGLFDRYPKARRYLFTATPIRSDGVGFADIADELEEVTTINDLLDHPDGPFLVYPRMVKGEDVGQNKDTVTVTSEKEGNETRTVNLRGDVLEGYKLHAAGRKGIIFCSGVKHSKMLCAQFNAAGITAEHIDGTLNENERSAVLSRLKTGHTQIVTNANVLCEGFDEGSISYIGLARETWSEALYLQMCGRGLRLNGRTWEESEANGKIDCMILDHGGNMDRFGHVCDPREWTLQGKKNKFKDKETVFCPVCYEGLPYHKDVCRTCGYTRIRKDIEIVTTITTMQEKAPENPIIVYYRKMLRYCRWCTTGEKDFSYAYSVLVRKYGFDIVRNTLPLTLMARMQAEVKKESRPARRG